MRDLEYLIRRGVRQGVSRGISDAIGKAVSRAVEPKATELANKAAAQLDQAGQTASRQAAQPASGLEGAFANLQRAAEGYATQMTKNMKVCPECGQPAGADQKFCPSCGAKLPEQTLGQGALCPQCGRQNTVGMKFCAECGTKLPAAIAEEEAAARQDEEELRRWPELLGRFPQWACGGSRYCIEEYEGWVSFRAEFPTHTLACAAVDRYAGILRENGFAPAGQYPSDSHLYKKEEGVCCHVDLEHCFESDAACPSLAFSHDEPAGGFDYVKPAPQKAPDLEDLKKVFKFFK